MCEGGRVYIKEVDHISENWQENERWDVEKHRTELWWENDEIKRMVHAASAEDWQRSHTIEQCTKQWGMAHSTECEHEWNHVFT